MNIFTSFFVAVFLLWQIPSILFAQKEVQRIIPKPQYSRLHTGTFTLDKQTSYYSNTTLANHAIVYLQKHLEKSSQYRLTKKKRKRKMIFFQYSPKKITHKEGYQLHIKKYNIVIKARDSAGFFYAVVSLMQMMDASIWADRYLTIHTPTWDISCADIRDYPRFAWRGMMLDTARNFFSVAYVKKFIDRMAQHKLNRFHWHLTDDEGWRIEIKHYPLLTQTGAKRGPHTKLPFSTFPAMRGKKDTVQEGYYTQAQIKDIVTYAKAREVEILPEIDMPGHAKAAIVSYPALLEDLKDKSQYTSVQKIHNNTINPALESTYTFIEDVIAEVSQLFPFAYIHMGGDEVPKGAWKKSSLVQQLKKKKGFSTNKDVAHYFFTRVDAILAKYKRHMIGWQEISKGTPRLRKKSAIMVWKNPQSAIKLLKKSYPVIMTPVQYLYFDQQYVRNKKEFGHTWSTPVSTQKVYAFRPPHSPNIYGVQASLWSETLLNESIADYLAWPRALALSEVAWTEQKKRHWKTFRQRMYHFGIQRLKVQHIHYRYTTH